MPILHNSIIAATTADDPVTRSLRFNGSVSSSEAGHLYRTAGTPTDEDKWTMSMWVKVGQQPTNGYMTLFGAGASNDNAASVSIYNGTLYADQATSSNHRTIRCSERLLRDPNAWYHLCFAYDNSQSGSSGNNQNAYKWYVNGVRLTEPTYSNNESVTGYTHRFNSSGYIQRIGKYAHRSYNSTYKYHWDGLIADVYFVDGQQLEPTEFIEANDYGGYIPKEYTGSFGANGFHLLFENTSSIGEDDAGSNDFTPTNISSHDVMLDNPFKNYCSLNPLAETQTASNHYTANPTTALTQGNLRLTSTYSYRNGHGTMGVSSGKWYFEWYQDGDWVVGGWSTSSHFSNASESVKNYWALDSGDIADSTNVLISYPSSAGGNNTSSDWDSGHSPSHENVFGCAFDVDNRKMYFHKNGEWSQGTGTLTSTFPSSYGGDLTSSNHIPLDSTFFPLIRTWYNSESGNDEIVIANFGQDSTFAGTLTSGSANATDTNGNGDFRYTPPSGYLALCSDSMSDPAVTPEENFNIALYNGNSSSNAITGLGFQPDVLWTKSRSTSGSSPKIFDSIRGVTKRLQPDSTAAEQTVSELTSFDSDGFTLGSDSGSNYSGRTYAAWNWKAHQSDARTSYTVRVEDAGGDAWDSSGSFYDSSTYLPSVYMEILESRNGTLVSLGKVAVRSLDADGNSLSNLSQQDYTLKCMNLDAIAVRWYYDTSGDGQEYDFPCSYNDLLNEQKITIQGGNWTTNNHSNDDGCTDYDYSAPTGWANGDSLKTATTSYNGTDTATLHASWESAPTEKYNAGAGFTIISYSGDSYSDGDTQTLNHSLGVPLEFVLAKNRTNSNGNTNGDWIVWHKDLPSSKFLKLNSNATTRTTSYGDIISTAVSGSQHQVVVANDNDNNSGTAHWLNDGGYSSPEEYILYGWASTAGMCKVGSYEGNGNSDGPFIAMDFAPAFFLYRNIDSSEHWYITYNKNKSYNVSSRNAMFAGHSNAESTESRYQMDFLSNGVKIRATHAKTNANNKTYLYLAMAEMPFKYGNGK